jgi:uncharacterized protein (DUF58 family)
VIPTGRLVALGLVPLVLGAVAVAWPAAVAPMLAIDALIVVVAAFDALRAGARFEVTRSFEPVQAAGRAFPVTLRIRAIARRAVVVRVVDGAPEPAPELRVVVGPGEVAEATYPLTLPSRGAHRFEAATVRWRSPLGLFERQGAVGEGAEVRVYPSFRQLRSPGLLGRADERRAPVRARRRPGGESEFERLRPYVRGDSYRHVDWRATARRRTLVAREFGQESNQNILFLLDAGRVMSSTAGDTTLFDRALDAALVLGQVALRRGDRVGLLVYDDEIRAWSPPRGGARAGVGLIRATYDVFPSLREPDHAAAMRWISQRVRRRSLVILLTSVIDSANAESIEAVTTILARRHLPLCVWLRDPSLEAAVDAAGGPARDPFTAGAAAELLVERARHLANLRDRGALTIDALPSSVSATLLARYLEVKARRLL